MSTKRIAAFVGASAVAAMLLVPQASLASDARSRAAEPQPQVMSQSTSHEPAHADDLKTSESRRPGGRAPGDIIDCPPDHHPVPFDMPIYDDDGLFVVDYETVWFCIPDDLEPAG